MSTSTGQAILAILEGDVLTTLGPQILVLLTDEKAANGDPLKSMAAWVKFQGAIAPALFSLESTLIGQIIGALQNKLMGLITKAQAGAVAAAPAVGLPPSAAGVVG